jgi:hypothetical protein
VKKIEKLTAKQQIQLVEYRQKWFDIGSGTQPADRETAERAITKMYGLIGQRKPRFVWGRSPQECTRIIAYMLAFNGKVPSAADLGSKATQISIEGKLKEAKQFSRFWGNNELAWQAFYGFCRDVLGVAYSKEDSEKLDLWLDISRSAGWWWAFEGTVVVSERPVKLNWMQPEAGSRLHCATGPSVEFSDGWKLYHWRGTQVPAEWIEDKASVSPETALTWRNVEQRRCLAEILGWGTILSTLKCKRVDKDEDPEIGELISVDLPDARGAKFLRVKCGTGRDFVLPVPAEMQTAREANAWTFSLKPGELEPEVRT